MKKIAVLFFPGMNCEAETLRTLKRTGFDAQVVLWNQSLKGFDGAVLPGGFSFEDRGRSGVIASREPILDELRTMASAGKPVLGICNGAQVLIEAGLAPDFNKKFKTEMALSRNERIDAKGEILGAGFYHSWVYLKNTASKGRCAFNDFEQILHMPIAHGEGRFMASDSVLSAIQENQMNVLTYCNENGEIIDSFPINPNGSALNMAGICNTDGNVMAMMPHPERTNTCDAIFASMHNYVNQSRNIVVSEFKTTEKPERKKADIEFIIKLKITDKAEKSMGNTLRKVLSNDSISLDRREIWSISSDSENLKELALKLACSGEIFNDNKESAVVRIGKKTYEFTENSLVETDFALAKNSFQAFERDDFRGQEKKEKINHHLGNSKISKISSGVIWSLSEKLSLEEVEELNFFQNPVSGVLIKA